MYPSSNGGRAEFLRKRWSVPASDWELGARAHPPDDVFAVEPSLSAPYLTRLNNSWDLSNIFCPCTDPSVTICECLTSWKEYCEWRSIPLHSPVALLLHWPLTIYYATQVAGLGSWTSGISNNLYIHYLGPEKELLQLSVFSELRALFPNMNMHIELVGPSIPQHRDGEMVALSNYAHGLDTDCICKSSSETVSGDVHTSEPSEVTLHLRSGFYHDRYMDITKDLSLQLVIAPNAGIAAYSSWSPTIELIKDMNIPAVFSNYCKEACHLGARCISSVTGHPLDIPIQLNPFRQPMAVEDSVLVLPCY